MVEFIKLFDEDTKAQLKRAVNIESRGNYQPYTIQKIIVGDLMKQLIVNLTIKTTASCDEILGLRRSDIDFENYFNELDKLFETSEGKVQPNELCSER